MYIILGITGTFEGYTTSPLYLFNAGTYGGGQNGITKTDATASSFNYSIGTSISGTGIYRGNIYFRFNNTQNLSNYNYIKVYGSCENWTGLGVGISTNSNTTSFSASSECGFTSSSSGNNTAILNISSINGSYYVYIWVGHSSGRSAKNASISKVYMENT